MKVSKEEIITIEMNYDDFLYIASALEEAQKCKEFKDRFKNDWEKAVNVVADFLAETEF
tara:strand:- start:463 stop:639 length:177 start_codon:yes stop_codon:yes gene_type:complete